MKHLKKNIHTYIGIFLIGLGVFIFVQINSDISHYRAGGNPEVVERHSLVSGDAEIGVLNLVVSNQSKIISTDRENEDLGIRVLDSRLRGNDVLNDSEIINQTQWVIGEVIYTIPISENMTAYDAMVYAMQNNIFSFEGKKYPMLGFFVTKIGTLDGTQGKNLMYYINDKEAPVGVSAYTLQKGDIIKWKLK